jgi:type IV secretion system protein TrbC
MYDIEVRHARRSGGAPAKARMGLLWIAAAALASFPTSAFAAGGGGTAMPWEGPIESVLNSLTGPVAQALCILAVVALGFGMAFSEGGGMMRRSMGILFGCSIAVTAVSFATTFFGFAAGAGM